jgi:hypothetical protein
VRPLQGSIRVECGNPRALPRIGQPLDSSLWRTEDGLLDEEYGVHIGFPSPGEIVLSAEHRCAEWFSWALQLQALRNQAALVHASGLERNGTAVLLATHSGFGKPALVGDSLRRDGRLLVGDDLTLLRADGICFGFPRASVRREDQPFLPEGFAQSSGPRAISGPVGRAGRFLQPLLRKVPGWLNSARGLNPHSTPVAPSDTSAHDRRLAYAPLDIVVLLQRRANLPSAQLRPTMGSVAAQLLHGTVSDFDARCVRICNVAMSLGLLDLETPYGVWIDVLRAGLVRARSYTLYAPENLPLDEIPGVVHELLDGTGIAPLKRAV